MWAAAASYGGVVADELAHDLGKGLGLAQGRDNVRASRQERDARVPQLVQMCDCRADAERVPRGKIGCRDLRSGAIDGYEGDLACGSIVVRREV